MKISKFKNKNFLNVFHFSQTVRDNQYNKNSSYIKIYEYNSAEV
jgi:hypothetical protein